MKKIFKCKNLFLVTFLAIAGFFSAGAIAINEQVKETPVVEKAEAYSTNVSNTRIWLQIIDSDSKTYSGSDMWIHCWNVTVDTTYSIFSNIADANNAGALSGYGYSTSDGSLDFVGSYYNWYGSPGGNYGTSNYRSYAFTFPWFITGFEYKVRVNGTDCKYSKSMAGHAKVVKTFWTNDGWVLDDNDKESSSSSYDVPANQMTFDTNGGSSVPSSPYKIKQYQKTLQPSNPTKPGNNFSKWTATNNPGVGAYVFGNALDNDITLYAQWTPSENYKIILWKPANDTYVEYKKAHSWYWNGSSDVAQDNDYSTITIGGSTYYYVNPTDTPSWVIFYKSGWAAQTQDLTIPSGGLVGQYYFDLNSTSVGRQSADDWKRIELTINYFDQGGGAFSGTHASGYPTNHNYGIDTTLDTPTKNGYTFGGWYPNSDCSGTSLTSLDGYAYTSNTINLYAKWNAATYTVSFNNGGGTGGSISPSSYTFKTSGTSTITVTAPTKTGYKNPTYTITRTGAYGGSTPTVSGSTITIPANSYGTFTINTSWSPNTNTPYTVKHYKQNLDGTYPSSPTDTDNLTGTTGASVTPARKNYEGFTAPAGQTVTILADGSRVVTYQYTRNSYTLTWDGNGGTVTGGTSGSVKYGATITQPNSVTREGYTFTGWNTTPAATMPAANTTYTAQWSISSYNLTLTVGSGIANIYYKINGAVNYTSINSTATVTVTYNSTFYLYATAKDGYILNSPYSGYTVDNPYSATMPASAQTWTPTFTSGFDAAQAFAIEFNDNIGEACTYAGGTTKDKLAGPWGDLADYYADNIKDYDYIVYWFSNSSDDEIVEYIGKYNYVYGKYGASYELDDFMGTGGVSASAINNFNPYNLIAEGENNSSTIIIVVASSISILSITALSVLMVKKRKAKQD